MHVAIEKRIEMWRWIATFAPTILHEMFKGVDIGADHVLVDCSVERCIEQPVNAFAIRSASRLSGVDDSLVRDNHSSAEMASKR